MEDADIIVVGAGAAGLAAAVDLAQAGLKVLLLEARDRIGGRIFTKLDAAISAPIELGAEFVHGRPPEILDLLKELHLEPEPTSGEDWCEKDGRLRVCDVFSDVDDILEKMDDSRPDESFQDFLGRCCPDASAELKQRITGYITGFHAADPALISVHSLVRIMRADAEDDGERSFHIPGGYQVLVDALHKKLMGTKSAIQLNTIVQEIHWGSEGVKLLCHTDEGHRTYCSPAVLITVPLGVLQAKSGEPGYIRFLPGLPEAKKTALSQLAMGKVMRVTLRFRERFWDNMRPERKKTLSDMRFLFSRQRWFPTWWTTVPRKLPMITGWAPFDCAEELSGQDSTLIFSSAMETLRNLFHMREQEIEDLVETAAFHDWQADPFSLGAYSYVKVGGDSAQADLGAPLESKLFFAGEATDTSDHTGTVHGAIFSGKRAAREILLTGIKSRTQ